MLYLIWNVLNLIVFGLLISLSFKKAKAIRDKYGLLYSFLFIFLFYSVFSNCSESRNGKGSTSPQVWNFEAKERIGRNGSFILLHPLDSLPGLTFDLTVSYDKNKQGQFVPISATSSVTGFIGGIGWKPRSVRVVPAQSRQFLYSVVGIVEWKFIGITIYSKIKEFKGSISIK